MNNKSSYSESEKENFKRGIKNILRDTGFTALRAKKHSEDFYSSDVEIEQREAERDIEKLTDIGADITTEIYYYFRAKGIELTDHEVENKLFDFIKSVSHKIHSGKMTKEEATKVYINARKN